MIDQIQQNLLPPKETALLVIDVQGARQVRRQAPRSVAVFVLPPSFAILESRLRGRSQESEDAMQRRLSTARSEVSAFVEYDYVVVNDEVGTCVDRLRAIILAERARLAAMSRRLRRSWRAFGWRAAGEAAESGQATRQTERTSARCIVRKSVTRSSSWSWPARGPSSC